MATSRVDRCRFGGRETASHLSRCVVTATTALVHCSRQYSVVCGPDDVVRFIFRDQHPRHVGCMIHIHTHTCTYTTCGVCPVVQGFTCPRFQLSYRHRVRVRARARVRFSVKFWNLHYYISDKWTLGQVDPRTTDYEPHSPPSTLSEAAELNNQNTYI